MRREYIICLVITLATVSQGKRWNTNKDSIIVDAHFNSEENEQVQFDDASRKSECYTSEGEPGECVTMVRCHPILFSEKGQLRNAGLAITYAQADNVCSSKNTLDGSSEKQSSEGIDEQIGQKVICCSRDRIQYDVRSELDQDLETYTTTVLPFTVDSELPTTGSSNLDEVSDSTPVATINVEDDIVIVESDNKSPSSVAPVEVDVEVESITTLAPTQTIIGDPVQEPGESVTSSSVDIVGTFAPASQAPTSGGQEQESPPVSVPPPTEDRDIFEPNPTSVCPSTSSYDTWPVFHDYPWLATIQTRAKTGPTCSGSLITESHILTNKICIHRFNSRDVARMQIRIGFSKRSSNDTFNDYYVLRNASKIIFHKRFHEESKMDNNIALIKLDEPVEFDQNVAPIGIFAPLGGYDIGNCTAAEAGWIKYGNRKVTGISDGVIQFVEPPTSDFHLRESLSRVLSNEECNTQLNSQITDKMICARTTISEEPTVSTDFFRWNDGGPLVVKVGNTFQQIGIKSWAYEGQQYPTVFIRVESYLDWIRNNLKM